MTKNELDQMAAQITQVIVDLWVEMLFSRAADVDAVHFVGDDNI